MFFLHIQFIVIFLFVLTSILSKHKYQVQQIINPKPLIKNNTDKAIKLLLYIGDSGVYIVPIIAIITKNSVLHILSAANSAAPCQ